MINVTKSFLPDLADFNKYLSKIWENGWLTNNGVYVQELEQRLKDHLGVKHLIFLSNGTVAIQIILKGMKLEGEVITTPFSYVATTSSLVWENCTPVFADIEPDTCCIDPKEVRMKITPNTKAILATHVFGNTCDVEELDAISKEFGIPVIYDAAHAFGVNHLGTSVLNYGKASTLSFHATKLFHTVEGGAIVTNDDELAERLEHMRRFGHNGPYDFHGVGINGKNSEIHAAMGLCVLPHMATILERRRRIIETYQDALKSNGARLTYMKIRSGTQWNYSYFPVFLESETMLKKVVDALRSGNVLPRRYFYPSLNTLDYLEKKEAMPVSESIASRVLCLPLYPDLPLEDVSRIAELINETLRN